MTCEVMVGNGQSEGGTKKAGALRPCLDVIWILVGGYHSAGQLPIRLPLLLAEIFIFIPPAPPFMFMVMS